jgi:hypothetical protein
MKKHLLFILTAITLISGASVSPALAEYDQTPANVKKVELTETQKEELKALHKDILEKKKQLVRKYVEFGTVSKEMGDRMIQRYEEHYKMIEQSGFRMHYNRMHNHDKHHH